MFIAQSSLILFMGILYNVEQLGKRGEALTGRRQKEVKRERVCRTEGSSTSFRRLVCLSPAMHARASQKHEDIVLNAAAFALLSTRARVYLLLAWSAALWECEVPSSFFSLALSLPFHSPSRFLLDSCPSLHLRLVSRFEERAEGSSCALPQWKGNKLSRRNCTCF